jgi:hypothetical protein
MTQRSISVAPNTLLKWMKRRKLGYARGLVRVIRLPDFVGSNSSRLLRATSGRIRFWLGHPSFTRALSEPRNTPDFQGAVGPFIFRGNRSFLLPG